MVIVTPRVTQYSHYYTNGSSIYGQDNINGQVHLGHPILGDWTYGDREFAEGMEVGARPGFLAGREAHGIFNGEKN